MKNFIFKSSDPDLQKMFSILDNLQKNMLYITYKVDAILKLVKSAGVDAGLNKQVDDFFEDSDIPDETSDKEPD